MSRRFPDAYNASRTQPLPAGFEMGSGFGGIVPIRHAPTIDHRSS